MIGSVVTLVGAVLILLSAIGVSRFPDVLARMQALTKAATVGVVLVAAGAAFVLPTANDVTSAIAAALLQLLTMPISAFLIARATYRARGIVHHVDTVDELESLLGGDRPGVRDDPQPEPRSASIRRGRSGRGS